MAVGGHVSDSGLGLMTRDLSTFWSQIEITLCKEANQKVIEEVLDLCVSRV